MKNRLWIIAFLAFLVLPVGAGSVYRAAHPDEDRLQIEEQENRRMAEIEWNNLFDSCRSIDSWYNDRAPLRSPLMNFYKQLNASGESFFDDNIAVPLDRLISSGHTDANTDPSAEEPQTPDFDWAAVLGGPEDTEVPFEEPSEEMTEPEPEPSGEEATENSAADPGSSLEGETDPESAAFETESASVDTEAPETTKAGKTTEAPETTKASETTKAVVSNASEAAPTQPVGSDPKKNHNLVRIQTVTADYEHWGYTDYRCTDCGRGFRLDISYKLVDSSPMSPRVVGQGVIIGRSGWYFYTGQRSVEYYRGQCLPTNQDLANYASVLTQIKARCDQLGIKLIILIAPNKEQVYSEYMPTYSVATTDKRENRIVRYLQGKGLTVLYPLSELKAGDLYHETYYRNDTHWTPYGAYIANTLIEKKLGMSPADPYSIDLPGYTKTIRNGDLIQLGGLTGKSIPYFVPTPNPSVTVTSNTTASNGNVRRTVSNNPNKKSLVLIGDSFRNNMADTLAKDFRNTLILHRDYLSTSMKNEILRANVLVLETVERYDVQFFAFLPKVLEILKMTAEPVTETEPETTAAPTTEAPTTAAPTTEAPTTAAPETTVAPTTAVPETTAAPTTAPPETTAAPTTEAPTEPTTEAPTEPTTAEPTTEATTEAVTEPPATEPETTQPPATTAPPETTEPAATEPETTVPTEAASPEAENSGP